MSRAFITLSIPFLLALPQWAQAQEKPPENTAKTPEQPAKGPNASAAQNATSLIALGRRELNRGAPGNAEAIFRDAINSSPQNALAHNELGVALFQQGAAAAAIRPLEKAVKLDPKLHNAWANLGEARRRASKFKKAAYAFHKFLQLRKGEPYALYGLGLSFEGYDALKKALKTMRIALKRSLKENQDPLTDRIRLAIVRLERKVLDARRPALERGDELVRAGRYQEALSVYNKALGKERTDGVLLGRVGLVHGVMGEQKTATETLREALLHAPTDPVARAAYILIAAQTAIPSTPEESASESQGTALLNADRAALAYQQYARVLTLDPNSQVARTGHGEAALRLGRLDEALTDFERAGDDRIAITGTAEVQWIQGQDAAAKKTLSDAGKRVSLSRLAAWRRSLLQQ